MDGREFYFPLDFWDKKITPIILPLWIIPNIQISYCHFFKWRKSSYYPHSNRSKFVWTVNDIIGSDSRIPGQRCLTLLQLQQLVQAPLVRRHMNELLMRGADGADEMLSQVQQQAEGISESGMLMTAPDGSVWRRFSRHIGADDMFESQPPYHHNSAVCLPIWSSCNTCNTRQTESRLAGLQNRYRSENPLFSARHVFSTPGKPFHWSTSDKFKP